MSVARGRDAAAATTGEAPTTGEAATAGEAAEFVRPELTALSRARLSLPARQALVDGLLDQHTVLDYGCGRGGDVRRLGDLGVDVTGWDPHFRPEPDPRPADVVMCNYVLNVIADPEERVRVLRRAWDLTGRVLVLAVRGTHEARHLDGREHGDGTITRRGTFHHLFGPAELRAWVKDNLDVAPVPVEPGVAYVFRSNADRASYLSRRYGEAITATDSADIINQLSDFLTHHGRAPSVDEQPQLCADARRAYGQQARAVALARSAVDPQLLERAANRRRKELLVLLALERFHGGPRLSDLPADRIADIRHAYDSFRSAVQQADRLLRATGQMEHVRAAVRSRRVGKTSPTALYVHVDAEAHLSPLLQLYASCAAMVAARPDQTTLLKLHHDQASVSFLQYPHFDRDAHPRLEGSTTINLRKLTATWTDWSAQSNRPLLHRKEEFLHFSDPRYDKFQRLTRSEVRAGLYTQPERIGREAGWETVLAEHGRTLRGHRLVKTVGEARNTARITAVDSDVDGVTGEGEAVAGVTAVDRAIVTAVDEAGPDESGPASR